MKTLSNNTQVLNIHYRQELTSDILNKIFYSLLTAGVIEGNFTFVRGSTSVTIWNVSFLIHPQNKPDILVRIDTTEAITLSNSSPSNTYLIARYRWENENIGAEFLFSDDANVVETDVILAGIVIDRDSKIVALDYDQQERARVKAIQKDTLFPLISQLDGYRVGHDEGRIPISDGVENTSLVAEYLNGRKVTEYAVSKEAETVTYNETTQEAITKTVIYPSWMNVDAVKKGEGITAEMLGGYSVQPQDGTTLPSLTDKIPVANTVLQKELNAAYLGGYNSDYFAKEEHTHNLDELIEGSGYFPVMGMSGTNQATQYSIEDGDITYREITPLARDKSVVQNYSPVYETGSILLKGYTVASVTFANAQNGGLGISDPRVFLQRAPRLGEAATVGGGLEKRKARIMSISETGFSAQQMGSIIDDSGVYKKDDSADGNFNQYYYFVIGKKIEGV